MPLSPGPVDLAALFDELERQLRVLTRQMTGVCQEMRQVAEAYRRAAERLVAEANAAALAARAGQPFTALPRPETPPPGASGVSSRGAVPREAAGPRGPGEPPPGRGGAARGGYASPPEPVHALPPVPAGPAPGARDPDHQICVAGAGPPCGHCLDVVRAGGYAVPITVPDPAITIRLAGAPRRRRSRKAQP